MENLKISTIVKTVKNEEREKMVLSLMQIGMDKNFLNELPIQEIRKLVERFL